MGRAPCCDKANVKKGPWSPEEDRQLKDYIQTHGIGGNWITFPQKAGLRRCGKSCRLRWLNYLRPNIKHGEFSDDEEKVICTLFASIGSRWSLMAAHLPGRTDNDIKNYWNTKLKKKMMNSLISMPEVRRPVRHLQSPNSSTNYSNPSLSFIHHSIFNISTPLSSSSPSPPSSYMHITNTSRNHDHQALSIPASPTATAVVASDHHHHQPVLQSQDYERYQGVKDSSTLVMLGGDHASSCSNSDGSFHYEYGSVTTGGVHDCNNMENCRVDSYKGFVENYEKEKGYYEDSSLDSCLEEIKQIISTNNLCNSNIDNNLNFFSHDTKEVEEVMYY